MNESKPTKKLVMSDMVPAKKITKSAPGQAPFVQAKFVQTKNERHEDSEEDVMVTPSDHAYSEYSFDDDGDDDDKGDGDGGWSGDILGHSSRSLTPPRKSGGCLLWVVIAAAIIGLIIGVGGLFAHAEVVLVPKVWTGPVDAFVTLSQVRAAKTVMMGTATKTFTQEEVVPAVSVSSQESPATGTVRFYNAGTVSRTLESGTTIIAAKTGAAYTVTKTVSLPASKGKTPSQVDVTVNSLKTGADQNEGLDDFTFSIARVKDFPLVTIHAVTPMTGGSSLKDAVADPSAVADATARVVASFADTTILVQRMSEELPVDMVVVPVPFPASTPSVTTEAGHPDGVHVVAREAVTVLLVPRSDIAAALAADLAVPAGIPVILKSFEGLTVTTNDIVSGQSIPHQVQIRITGTATVTGKAATGISVIQLVGSTRKQIRDVFTQNPAIASVDIHMTPFWRRILPLDASKISIKVK